MEPPKTLAEHLRMLNFLAAAFVITALMIEACLPDASGYWRLAASLVSCGLFLANLLHLSLQTLHASTSIEPRPSEKKLSDSKTPLVRLHLDCPPSFPLH